MAGVAGMMVWSFGVVMMVIVLRVQGRGGGGRSLVFIFRFVLCFALVYVSHGV